MGIVARRSRVVVPIGLCCLAIPSLISELSAQEILQHWIGEGKLGIACVQWSDFDGDAVDEIAITSQTASRIDLFNPRSGELVASIPSPYPGEAFAVSMAVAGDVDGDGWTDLIVGSTLAARQKGRVAVFSGADLHLIHEWSGSDTVLRLGRAVAPLGDADGDGLADVIVSAELADRSGALYAYSGGDGSILFERQGEFPDGGLGSSLAQFHDLNGDGVRDFLVGSARHSTLPGVVDVCSGTDGSLIHRLTSPTGSNTFGLRLALVPDHDGDDLEDFLVGDLSGQHDGIYVGLAFLFSSAGFTELWRANGNSQHAYFGGALASVGDVDGDGASDFLVGAYGEVTANGTTGAVYLYSGRTLQRIHRLDGFVADSDFGFSVCAGGDANGDGLADVVVGTPNYVDATWQRGEAHVFAGNDLYLRATPTVHAGETLEFNASGREFAKLALFLRVDSAQFLLLRVDQFDALAQWSWKARVPGGLGGLFLEFQAFALYPSGVADSAVALVEFW